MNSGDMAVALVETAAWEVACFDGWRGFASFVPLIVRIISSMTAAASNNPLGKRAMILTFTNG